MERLTDQNTIDIYNQIIGDVTEAIREIWRRKGNDPRILDKFRDNWTYETMKACGITMNAPESFAQQKSTSNIQTLDQVFQQFGLNFQAPVPEPAQQEAPQQNDQEEKDDDDDFEDIPDGDDKEDEQNKEKEASSSSSSYTSDSSDHEFDDDPELKELLTQVETDSQLLCHYTKTKDKGKKHIQEFELSHIHLTHNGQPLFIAKGTMSCKNNKARFG